MTAMLTLGSAPAVAQPASYKLSPGDVLQLTVIGFPELKQRAPINLNGEIMLPLVGSMKSSGLTVSDLSNTVKARFGNKVLQQRGQDGRAVSVVLSADEISIDILEYRPVYLRGDISKPGEQAFRPGMTVRQAVAVSGGYDFMRFRSGNPMEQAAQLRGENTSLWNEVLSKQAIVTRLRAETGGGAMKVPTKSAYEQSPLSPEAVEGAFKMEADQLASRRAERDREFNYLTSVLAQSDRRISLLTEQLNNEQEGSKQDVDDFERVSKLFEKGNTSITRFSDSRRSMLLSATRILQTSAAVAQVEREREEFRKLLADLDDKRKVEALKELQDAETKLQQAKARLAATQEQMLYSAKMRSQLGMSGSSKAEIVIIRDYDRNRERIAAQEDSELWPGDVVEIALDASQILGYQPN